jgi:arylsulfatase A-like enzyme
VKRDPERLLGDALAWARAHAAGRMFLYVHLMGAHAPYRELERCTRRHHPGTYAGPYRPLVTSNHLARLNFAQETPSPADVRWIRALYYGEITCQDEALGRFLEELRRIGVLDASLLVVTSDHGEALLEHGTLGHMATLYEEEIRTPLVMRASGLAGAGTVVDDVVESVAVAPTILEVLGLPAAPADGESLLPGLRGQPGPAPRTALVEGSRGHPARALRVGHLKLIVVDPTLIQPPALRAPASAPASRPGPPRPTPADMAAALERTPMAVGAHLFDLAADPGERDDRASSLPLARRYCEIHLGEALASPRHATRREAAGALTRYPPGRVILDAALRRQLEALGYLGQ